MLQKQRLLVPREIVVAPELKQKATMPTDTAASNSSPSLASPAHLSKESRLSHSINKLPLNMQEAQTQFRSVVRKELNALMDNGISREQAIQQLLGRIVEDFTPPIDEEVQHVMRVFHLNQEDAVRALIVKQELGRLRRRGLDSLSAMEEITRKMQGATVVCEDTEISENADPEEFKQSSDAATSDDESEDDGLRESFSSPENDDTCQAGLPPPLDSLPLQECKDPKVYSEGKAAASPSEAVIIPTELSAGSSLKMKKKRAKPSDEEEEKHCISRSVKKARSKSPVKVANSAVKRSRGSDLECPLEEPIRKQRR